MPTVRISGEHDSILKEEKERIREEMGIKTTKKSLVEKAIKSEYGDE